MKQFFLSVLLCALFLDAATSIAQQTTVTTTWSGDGAKIYDTGFMHMLMKSPDKHGACLFNRELIENDSPGGGVSEKGESGDFIFGPNRARKILNIDDPRAHKAYLVLFVALDYGRLQGKYPLRYTINGHESAMNLWQDSIERVRWTEFPAEWLKKGRNIVDLFCPEAKTKEDGWGIFFSRADEFEQGGGNPKEVGKTTLKSTDGGETWKESPFGPLGNTRAEYSVRISLDRSVPTGWLASPVIDLWKGEAKDFIVPQREIQKMRLRIMSDVPPETKAEYFLRKGSTPQPFAGEWSEYQFIGDGPALDYSTGGADLNRRYIQFRAVLSTANPLHTPVIKSVDLTAELLQRVPIHKNVYVTKAENPVIQYSSIPWEWEKWDRPEFQEIRKLENLDEVIAGSRTEFNAQVRLLDYVTKRWRHTTPFPEYPGWDAKTILDRIDTAGGGGMCIQFNNTLGGMCMAYGWQARLINVVGHEIIEVWNDEYGKWIFLDADWENNYNYFPATAEPQSFLDLHTLYLDYYFPGRSIDWMKDLVTWMPELEGKPLPVKRGSLTQHPSPSGKKAPLSGWCNAAFMRVIPRNNWYEKPYPRPLSHGMGTNWPWDGYLNWYDDRTPPKRQYSWHTDRPRDMWPDLNLVHVDATQGLGNDRLFLRFETYTPNFSHFEVNADDTGWKEVGERWTWLLQSGKNTLRVRAVNKLGAKGKPSEFVVNHADAPFGE
jgi:hypothetical protein